MAARLGVGADKGLSEKVKGLEGQDDGQLHVIHKDIKEDVG